MLKFAILVGCVAGALILANLLSRALRLPQLGRRIAVVLFSTAFALIPLYPLENAMKLGIDLSGGTILVYQVEQPPPEDFTIEKMVAALSRRVNPAGLMDVTIRGIGADRVELIIPKATKEEVERVKRILTSVGSLEFRILANSRDHATLIADAQASFPKPVIAADKVRAKWVPIAPSAQANFSAAGEVAVRSDPKLGQYALVVEDEYHVTGEYLYKTDPTVDDNTGRPAVSFQFNSQGGRRFGYLTGENRPSPDGFVRRLAIVLNGEIQTAPDLRDQIHDRGIITGDFTRQEVDDYVAVLNAGSLPGVLIKTPASELTIGPTLGADTIRSGLMSMALSTVLVLVFMLVIYHLAGIVADIAVVLNTLIVVGVMAWVNATWTLAGLAGLALTIGMAVDANVLIYERLREEQQRGRSLRIAIEYAFHKAMSPIIDSNITTLMSGVVLYAIGTEQVKGFAVTLIIGLTANLFTAVFVCRLIFDIMEKKQWVGRLSMTQLFAKPNLDFTGKRRIALFASWVLILAGGAGVFFRGQDLLDIDFTGGTLAAVRFRQATNSAAVRRLASEATLSDVAVEELQLSNEPRGQRFIIRTTMQDQDKVRKLISGKFGGLLASTQMTPGPIETIPKTGGAETKPGAGGDSAKKPDAAGVPAASAESKPEAKPAVEASLPVIEKPSFPGGSRVVLSFSEPVTLSTIRGYVAEYLAEKGFPSPDQYFMVDGLKAEPGSADAYRTVQLESSLDGPALQAGLSAIAPRLAAASTFERLDNFGGQVALETQAAALVAVVISMLVIVGYLWIRFQSVLFGLGAVVSLIHDVFMVLGLVALTRWMSGNAIGDALLIENFKINLPIVAAFLTLVGYSVNDTIVVFDRIREVRGKGQLITWELINDSINSMLSRTLLTGLTTFFVAIILYAMGGSAIHGFAYCLIIGSITGTYSSIYIASPILIWFDFSRDRRRQTPSGGKRREGEAQNSGANGRNGGKGRKWETA